MTSANANLEPELQQLRSNLNTSDYPELSADDALCCGVEIDWTKARDLREFAERHTHAEEHARAARFLHAEDGLRHLLGRALLRKLAARYGGFDPNRIMPLNAWGKPEPAAPAVGCNLSHSGNQVWVAVANLPQVGIDVESATGPQDHRDIVHNFHPDEIAALSAAPASDSRAAMMRCWARKEAVSKAIGRGLSLPLDAYAVDCGNEAHDWLRIAPPGAQAASWCTIDLPLNRDYVGALAIAGRCRKITLLTLK